MFVVRLLFVLTVIVGIILIVMTLSGCTTPDPWQGLRVVTV